VADSDRNLGWLYLFCGLSLGALIVLLLRDRRGSGHELPTGSGQPINIYNNIGDGAGTAPQRLLSSGSDQPLRGSQGTSLSTVTLDTDSAIRIATALERTVHVEVTTVGPPGSYAFIGTTPSPTIADNLTVPAGASKRIKLRPRDALFAFGSVDGVVVSVSASES
jgi:hypothetical protein